MFQINAWTVHHYQDRDNYPVSRDQDACVISANNLDELYEKIAHYRIEHESGIEERYGDYYRCDFDSIVEVISSQELDEERLKSTAAFVEHQAYLGKQAREKQARIAAAQLAQIKSTEERERAEFLRLQTKYGKN